MQKHTSTILTLMIGLLLGRLVTLHDLGVMELTGLFLLALCYRSEIWNGIQRLATRPAVRAYVAPQSTRVHGILWSIGVIRKLVIAAALLFGGLLLLLDALHRHS
jgi:hypothetical protein